MTSSFLRREQNVQVNDTTGDAIYTVARQQIISLIVLVNYSTTTYFTSL